MDEKIINFQEKLEEQRNRRGQEIRKLLERTRSAALIDNLSLPPSFPLKHGMLWADDDTIYIVKDGKWQEFS